MASAHADLINMIGFGRRAYLLGQCRCAVLSALPPTAMHSLLSTMFMAAESRFGDHGDLGRIDRRGLVEGSTVKASACKPN